MHGYLGFTAQIRACASCLTPDPPHLSNPPCGPACAGWADHPWWHVDTWSRIKHAVTLTQELLDWVRSTYPYWNRTGGADHVWHFAHDEGACWAPEEVYRRSIILTHWGRMDAAPVSQTTYEPVRAVCGARGMPAGSATCSCCGRRARTHLTPGNRLVKLDLVMCNRLLHPGLRGNHSKHAPFSHEGLRGSMLGSGSALARTYHSWQPP